MFGCFFFFKKKHEEGEGRDNPKNKKTNATAPSPAHGVDGARLGLGLRGMIRPQRSALRVHGRKLVSLPPNLLLQRNNLGRQVVFPGPRFSL